MKLTITAYSTALFSTWINVEELNLLIDAGDGLTSGLLQKSRKIKHVFITHPDRDHLNGLPQYLQLNSREGFPRIYYPSDSGSFPALNNFLNKFDPHVKSSEWKGIIDGEIIEIKKGYEIHALRNEHIKAPLGVNKSLSYKLFETRQKLKDEFKNLSPNEIKHVVKVKGRSVLTEVQKSNLISFQEIHPLMIILNGMAQIY